MAPNRVVAIAVAILTLILAILPTLASFDWTSTAGILAGIGGVAAVTLKWLDGWQLHEERTSLPLDAAPAEPDKGDIHALVKK